MRFRRALAVVALALVVGGLAALAVRVARMAREELDEHGGWQSLAQLQGREGATRISARLLSVELRAGERALFELCGEDGLPEGRWRDALQLVVWRPGAQAVELKVPLDAAHLALVKREPGGVGCMELGGGAIEASGDYALDAVWPAGELLESLSQVPLRGRVLARTPIGRLERALVWLVAFGGLALMLSAFVPRREDPRGGATRPEDRRGGPAGAPPARLFGLALGGLVAVAAAALVLWLPLQRWLAGPLAGLTRGLALSAVEIAVAWGFARYLTGSGDRRAGLSLYAPVERGGLAVLGAVGCALLLNPVARGLIALVPSTGRAPIEAFIAWPSGELAFAALGMVVPLAEEVFFRGFVFGALLHLGRAAAFFGTVVLFVAAHAQQTWGNWGALSAIAVTGTVLTGLRAATGSTLVPVVAHLLYNVSLWLRWL